MLEWEALAAVRRPLREIDDNAVDKVIISMQGDVM